MYLLHNQKLTKIVLWSFCQAKWCT